jgi:hypothetical protein
LIKSENIVGQTSERKYDISENKVAYIKSSQWWDDS